MSNQISRTSLILQMTFAAILVIPFQLLMLGLVRVIGGYRIENLQRLRLRYRHIMTKHPRILICANHLTFIDSIFIVWAIGSCTWYQRYPRKLPWNLPAGDFFKKRLAWRIIALFSKCIFIHRDGSKEHKHAVLNTCKMLLAKGHPIIIFPEGQRSRSGVFEPQSLTYGAAKLICELDNEIPVLCVYVRARGQKTYANYPPRGSNIYMDLDFIMPSSALRGHEACHDIRHQIGRTIKEMENQYFEETEIVDGAERRYSKIA